MAQIQVWPELRYLEAAAPSTAASRSASSNTMTGAFPPNSMDTFLTVSAHSLSRVLPTGVEPVKVSLRIVSLPVSTDEEVVTFASTEVARDPNKAFIVKADEEVPYERFDAVLDALKQSKVKYIYLLSDQKTIE